MDQTAIYLAWKAGISACVNAVGYKQRANGDYLAERAFSNQIDDVVVLHEGLAYCETPLERQLQ